MIASLPMYDWPHTHATHDALWALIRDRLRDLGTDAPDTLDRDTPHMDGWARPDLVLGQICNLPYRAQFRGRVTRIGCGDYGLPDTPPGYYHSVFLVRRQDPAQSPYDCADYRFAYNEPLSNSGYGAPQIWAATRGFQFRPALHTHSHGASALAVAEGRADLCAIDAQTWRLMQDSGHPAVGALRLLGKSDCSPGMTFITRPGQDPAPLFAAISDAIDHQTDANRRILSLRGIVALPDAAYDIPLPPVVAG